MSKSSKPPRGLVESTTGVYRLPKALKETLEAEASAEGTSPAAVVREALVKLLEKRGWEFEAELRRACGVG